MPDLVKYGSYSFPAGTTATIAHPVVRNPNGPRLAGAETWTVTGWLAAGATYAAAEAAHVALLNAVASDTQALTLVNTSGGTERTMPTFQEDTQGPYVTDVTFSEPVAVWGTAFSVTFTNVAPDGGGSTTAREKLLASSSATHEVTTDESGMVVETFSGTLTGTRSASYAVLKQHLQDLVLARVADGAIRSFTLSQDLFRQSLNFTITALVNADTGAPELMMFQERFSLSTDFSLVRRRKPRGGAPLRYQVGDYVHTLTHEIMQEGRTAYPTLAGPLESFKTYQVGPTSMTREPPRLDSRRRAVAYPVSETYIYELDTATVGNVEAAADARLAVNPVLTAPVGIADALARITENE